MSSRKPSRPAPPTRPASASPPDPAQARRQAADRQMAVLRATHAAAMATVCPTELVALTDVYVRASSRLRRILARGR